MYNIFTRYVIYPNLAEIGDGHFYIFFSTFFLVILIYIPINYYIRREDSSNVRTRSRNTGHSTGLTESRNTWEEIKVRFARTLSDTNSVCELSWENSLGRNVWTGGSRVITSIYIPIIAGDRMRGLFRSKCRWPITAAGWPITGSYYCDTADLCRAKPLAVVTYRTDRTSLIRSAQCTRRCVAVENFMTNLYDSPSLPFSISPSFSYTRVRIHTNTNTRTHGYARHRKRFVTPVAHLPVCSVDADRLTLSAITDKPLNATGKLSQWS